MGWTAHRSKFAATTLFLVQEIDLEIEDQKDKLSQSSGGRFFYSFLGSSLRLGTAVGIPREVPAYGAGRQGTEVGTRATFLDEVGAKFYFQC